MRGESVKWDTFEDFMGEFLVSNEDLLVVVDDSVQRHEVVEILLENGCFHGISGESKEMFDDPSYATDKWMRIFNTPDGLEYGTYPRDDEMTILFDEFMQLVHPATPTQVDDLI